ncbi:white collar 1 protein [Lichtheimia corymbifera JMRC:FSU:9682]|uniref:White collar 1 protein n=1 Tax=Lichtheimia corymbifera JMRC:FSU:9682 TaxID=1263082 RepID=A0A068RX94_9FUNG|nr:white collar 1 protein [Lichtheimia corymbifera JMRC:FSU:9682]
MEPSDWYAYTVLGATCQEHEQDTHTLSLFPPEEHLSKNSLSISYIVGDDDTLQLASADGVPMIDLTAVMDPFAGILDAESSDPTFNVVAPQSTAPPATTTSVLSLSTSTSAGGGALTGVYSSSGFDMIGVLSRVVNRPNLLINFGHIDMSCSFLVTDARQFDCPIVYCSPNFETLTGYKSEEILGHNCRFLQAPDGLVTEGSRRQHTDNLAGGQPFVNLVTVIPVPDDNNETAFFVGLQIDLVEQPNAILEKMKSGGCIDNYGAKHGYLSNSGPGTQGCCAQNSL